jgi:hypothetical protein
LFGTSNLTLVELFLRPTIALCTVCYMLGEGNEWISNGIATDKLAVYLANSVSGLIVLSRTFPWPTARLSIKTISHCMPFYYIHDCSYKVIVMPPFFVAQLCRIHYLHCGTFALFRVNACAVGW